MADAATVRRLAAGAAAGRGDSRGGDHIAFELADGGRLVWTFMRRVREEGARSRPEVVAIHCQVERKEMLVEAAPDRYFDDDHYRGFPAVMVRLAAIDDDELAAMLQAPGGFLQGAEEEVVETQVEPDRLGLEIFAARNDVR